MLDACDREGGYMVVIVAKDLDLITTQHEDILLSTYNQRGRCSRPHGVQAAILPRNQRQYLPINDKRQTRDFFFRVICTPIT